MHILNINQRNENFRYAPSFGRTSNFHTIAKFQLKPDEIEKISQMSESLSKISEFFASLNGILQKKFKSNYPGLVAGEKIKGFLFDSILGGNGKKLQIVRLNTRPDSEELLTFGLLDSSNKNILRYKVNKNGDVVVMKEKLNSEPVDTGIFSEWNLDTFIEELKYLNIYSQNFNEVNRKLTGTESIVAMHKLLDKIIAVKKSEGIKNSIENVVESFNEVSSEFNKNSWRGVVEIKRAYFGKFAQEKSKSMFFKDPVNSKIYSYTPAKSVADNRIFRLMVCDESGRVNDGFLFFSDGKVARIRPEALNSDFIRGRKMEYLSDDEIKNLNLKGNLSVVDQGLKDFKAFIVEKRSFKKKNTNAAKENSLSGAIKKIPQIKPQGVKNVSKEQRKVQPKKQMASPIIKSGTQNITAKKTVAQNKNIIEKVESHAINNSNKTSLVTQSVSQTVNKTEFINTTLTSLAEKLTNLFDTPVEERSSHLVHEKLQNGRIFSGRVSFIASDGAQITVSRIKSPRYVDFMYYSIKVSDGKSHYVMNLDPEAGLILESTPEGKVIIDKKQRVKHLSKKEFIELYPQAINLERYLKELFEFKTDGKRKVVTSNLKMKGLTLKEREKEVLKALGQSPDIALDSLFKL